MELTNDLQVAKVYVSIFSDELGREQAMAGLKNLAGYARPFFDSFARWARVIIWSRVTMASSGEGC